MHLLDITPESPNSHSHFINIQRRLTEVANRLWPTESHKLIRDKLKKLDEQGTIDSKKAKDCWSDSPYTVEIIHSPSEGEEILKHYIAATVYNSRARFTHSTDLSFSLLKQTMYHLGALEWHIAQIDYTEMKARRASIGGNSHEKIKKTVSKKLEELLNNPPPGGWESVEKTADALEYELQKFLAENNIERYRADTFEYIKRSLKPNKPYDIYLKNSKKLLGK